MPLSTSFSSILVRADLCTPATLRICVALTHLQDITLDGTNDAMCGRGRLASRKHASSQRYLESWLQIREPAVTMSNFLLLRGGWKDVLQNRHLHRLWAGYSSEPHVPEHGLVPPSLSQKHSHHSVAVGNVVAADAAGCDAFSVAPPLLAVQSWGVEERYGVAEWRAEDGEGGCG